MDESLQISLFTRELLLGKKRRDCGFPLEVPVKVNDRFVRTHDDFTIWSEERCRYLESESIHVCVNHVGIVPQYTERLHCMTWRFHDHKM